MKRIRERAESDAVEEWLVVLNATGVVESIEGGAPATWVGKVLTEIAGTPGILRRAVAELVLAPPASHVRRRKVRCVDEKDQSVDIEVVLVEALPLRRAPAPVSALVIRTLDFFASQARSNQIDLTIQQAENLTPTVLLDAEKISWALSTLLVNALRYARAHVGVQVSSDEATGELVIAVSDDGPGIPEDKLRWLFERDPVNGQSSGLALPMVRDVMTAHRGSVTVERNPARRTTFTLRIPQATSTR